MGETIKESSERELKEKANLSANLKHHGDVYITVFDGEEMIMHTLFHIHSGKNPAGELKEETPIGYCYWSKIDAKKKMEYFPGFLEVYNLLRKNPRSRFFKEYVFRL